ncbi:MAG: heavy metal translocating P-type ATPase [Gammaproteobacteria bacterium]
MTENPATQSNYAANLLTFLSLLGIASHLVLRYGFAVGAEIWTFRFDTALDSATGALVRSHFEFRFAPLDAPLLAVLLIGGSPLVLVILKKLLHGDLGADLLAGISIVTALLLSEYLAGALIVLMLSGGIVLEAYAVRRASSVLQALASRMPSIAHRRSNGTLLDIETQEVRLDDVLVILPHEICPVDGTVIEGSGVMDESYLTGEPYMMSKVVGSTVLSGAVNGDSALTIRADRLAIDSRYAKIMQVMRASEQNRPRLRRLGDQLGALYAPLALLLAGIAWFASGEVIRFLAVLVVATPCPLFIGIPVALISSISLAAKREIVIKNPAILETLDTCRTAIFDKTGTLTYGRPALTQLIAAPPHRSEDILTYAASLERYSKHPLSNAIIKAAEAAGSSLLPVTEIQELPGKGLSGKVAGKQVVVTSRKQYCATTESDNSLLPPLAGGLECLLLIDGQYAATLQFRDEIRSDSSLFINHLKPSHLFDRVILVSGDKESEVRYLANQVGIEEVYFGQSPEQKLSLVRKETQRAKTVFMGDGINDAPALTAATIGIAFGQNSDITAESADAVIMDSSLLKVDELLHIGKRMRAIALQSALGGILLSVIAMGFAGFGYLAPVAGAIVQEVIDIFAILNALRAAFAPRSLSDY